MEPQENKQIQKLLAYEVSRVFLEASIRKGRNPTLRYGQSFWNTLYDYHKELALHDLKNEKHYVLYQSDRKDVVTDYVMSNLVSYETN